MRSEMNKMDPYAPQIDEKLCTGCGDCVSVCPAEALALQDGHALILNPEDCWYCGECEEMCPVGAISRSFEITFADGV
jgi:formate hydrogenlyase subunit 6/NADH:ubiquinone oxidoreductase subunit I